MIVVVESNFVLEMAFQQEEVAETEFIVALAACNVIRLVIPGCALFEPYETLIRRRKIRQKLGAELECEVNQLARSAALPHMRATSQPLADALADSIKVEARELDSTIRRLTGLATVIPLSDQIVNAAIDIRREFELDPQDAIVFASVDQFVRAHDAGTAVFANRNARDFATSDVKAHFRKYDCQLLSKFADAAQFIKERVWLH